jgi:hypothetical protein
MSSLLRIPRQRVVGAEDLASDVGICRAADVEQEAGVDVCDAVSEWTPRRAASRIASRVLSKPYSSGTPIPRSVANESAAITSAARPQALARHVVLRRAAFGEFAAETAASSFDVAIFSWSLCCMERDDMVPALEEAHRLVGTAGTVVDIHAVSGTAEVEVHRSGEIAFAEPASTSDGEGERNADEAVATVVARGLFVPERRTEFDFRVYAPALRELRDFLEEADAHARREGSETSDAYESQLYERVEQMIAAGPSGAEVAYHERAGITRLKPVGT